MKHIYIFIFAVGAIHAMQMVTLRDGSVRPHAAVEKTILKLQQLSQGAELLGILAIYHLQQKAVNYNFPIWDNTEFLLVQYNLLAPDGTMSDIVRSVVLSAIKFNHDTSQLWIHCPIVGGQ